MRSRGAVLFENLISDPLPRRGRGCGSVSRLGAALPGGEMVSPGGGSVVRSLSDPGRQPGTDPRSARGFPGSGWPVLQPPLSAPKGQGHGASPTAPSRISPSQGEVLVSRKHALMACLTQVPSKDQAQLRHNGEATRHSCSSRRLRTSTTFFWKEACGT